MSAWIGLPKARRLADRAPALPGHPGQTDKLPFHIPLAVGLLARRRQQAAGYPGQRRRPRPELTRVLSVTEAEQTFTFVGLNENRCPRCCATSRPRCG